MFGKRSNTRLACISKRNRCALTKGESGRGGAAGGLVAAGLGAL